MLQAVVDPSHVHELVVRAGLCNNSLIEYADQICVLNGAKTVGNCDTGAAQLGLIQCFLNNLFTLRI